MTAALSRVSARRTVLGAVELRCEPLLEEVLDALGRAALRDPDRLLALLVESGEAQAGLDDDADRRSIRPVDLAAIRDDLCTLADYGHATTILPPATARRLHHELGTALHHTERTAA